MKRSNRESGQMIVLTAIELILLLGFVALAADVGFLFRSQRHMQTAADAAATAGALNDYNASLGYTTRSDVAAARDAAAANGYTNGQSGVQVTVNVGSAGQISDGYHQSAGYVEVIISKPDPLYFFKYFTGNGAATVSARAVAGDPSASPGCFWSQTLYIKGQGSISGSNGGEGCGIYVNSTASNAIYNQDSSTTIYSAYLDTPGGGGGFATQPTTVTSPVAPVTQPYADLPTPTDASGGPCVSGVGGNEYTAASYTGGTLPSLPYTFTSSSGLTTIINVTCFMYKNVSLGNGSSTITLNNGYNGNGFFFFDNGVTINGYVQFGNPNPSQTIGSSSIGATIYNYQGQLNYNSNSYITAYAPTAGVFNGVAIYQPLANTNSLNVQFGNSGASAQTCTWSSTSGAGIDGYVVAPGATVSLQDEGGAMAVTGLVASQIYVNSPLVTCNYNSANQATTPFRTIALVE
jgi:hypothetical protein